MDSVKEVLAKIMTELDFDDVLDAMAEIAKEKANDPNPGEWGVVAIKLEHFWDM